MKNILKLTLLGVAMLGISSAAFAGTGPLLSIGGVHQTISGDTVTLTLNISGLQQGGFTDGQAFPLLGGFNLSLDYNPAVLSLTSDSFGCSVNATTGLSPDGSDLQTDSSSSGVVSLNDIGLDTASTQATSFELATLTFQAVGTGSSPLAWDFTPGTGTNLTDPNGNDVAFTTTNNATISYNGSNLTVVPEPGTYAAALSGLGMLVLVLSKRSRVSGLRRA